MRYILILLALTISSPSIAGLSQYYEGHVTEIGYEAGRGLIRLDTVFSEQGCSAVYADLTQDTHKVAYSTALTAKMSGSRVKIRFDYDNPKYYSYCQVFQLTIMP